MRLAFPGTAIVVACGDQYGANENHRPADEVVQALKTCGNPQWPEAWGSIRMCSEPEVDGDQHQVGQGAAWFATEHAVAVGATSTRFAVSTRGISAVARGRAAKHGLSGVFERAGNHRARKQSFVFACVYEREMRILCATRQPPCLTRRRYIHM